MRSKKQPVIFVHVGFEPDYIDALSRSARLDHLKEMKAMVIGEFGTEFPAATAGAKQDRYDRMALATRKVAKREVEGLVATCAVARPWTRIMLLATSPRELLKKKSLMSNQLDPSSPSGTRLGRYQTSTN
jgi:hypothetical protein